MRKEKYTLNDYYKYAIEANYIMTGWNKVNEKGYVVEVGNGCGASNQEWCRNIAYHHWTNKDDLMKLFKKLGLCNDEIENCLSPEKRYNKWIKNMTRTDNV